MPDTAAAPRTTHRLDYRPPAFLVDSADLRFDLDPAATTVRACLVLRRNPHSEDRHAPLRLDGEGLALLGIKVDGRPLPETHYALGEDGSLTLPNPSDILMLETEVRIAPEKNSAFSGLYTSGGNFYTQCEAEGFRRITFFPDRPDAMTRFTVTLAADKARCPVLLSNGNPSGTGEEEGTGRHWAKWDDPHPKPSYLFALVAGDLVAVSDYFTTKSGRDVVLNIWVRSGDEDRCAYAMDSLKRSMTWDEQVYGFEYDLDVFNIAAVSDFNMGAMENKGLNVFNTKYVLAKPDTATDGDYQGVETVIAHEYFHNWTGNRVTCRDWFQLSLKEGLTVFRDQEFSGDQGSRAVKRIRDVRGLRAAQFPEDAGPMAHPVRPESYIEIDNFYTPTVYQKGAEVVRLLHTRIGPEAFRKGMDLYVERHDNSAATIEDFRSAMQDASGVDLSAFAKWYEQAGTPELTAEGAYDETARRYTLTLRQNTPPTPGQPDKGPLPIPVAMGLLDAEGSEQPTRLEGENEARPGTRTLLLQDAESRFVFEDVAAPPVPSLLRGFSAPVKLRGLALDQLRVLAARDTDPFTRWDSGQQYAAAVMLEMVAGQGRGEPLGFDPGLAEAVRANLAAADADPALAAEALILPGENFLADQMAVADPQAIHAVRQHLRRRIGADCRDALRSTYDRLADGGPYKPDGASIGRRALRNACLAYLAAADEDGMALVRAQFDAAANMTDSLAALSLLTDSEALGDAALAAFHARWRGDELVLDKWFAIQAMSHRAGSAVKVRALEAHPDFSLRNPNRVRSLLGAFASGNPARFHDPSGEGYRLLGDAVVALDPLNASTAARLVGPLAQWRRQAPPLQAMMKRELERVLAAPKLSKGTFEKASKGLA